MIIIGCDYHPSFQQIAFVDTETGELQQQRIAGIVMRILHPMVNRCEAIILNFPEGNHRPKGPKREFRHCVTCFRTQVNVCAETPDFLLVLALDANR